jgi:hypothetical protein
MPSHAAFVWVGVNFVIPGREERPRNHNVVFQMGMIER